MDINELTYLINGAIFEVNRILIELKTVDRIEKIHEAQLLNYLKATGINVGLLVNFKSRKAEIKRLVLDLPE
jgi:GxxExxY protein